jgi:hypothetical protein
VGFYAVAAGGLNIAPASREGVMRDPRAGARHIVQ